MTDKLSLIESIVNENAVDFRQIVNKVLLEKLSVRLDEEYKDVAKNLFVLAEAEEEVEEETDEEGEEDTEGEDEEVTGEQMPEQGYDRVRRSYGAY